MKTLRLTDAELSSLRDAAELCIEWVTQGRIWQNEDPALLQALRRAFRKLRTEQAQISAEVRE